MSAFTILPAIDLRGGRCVRLRQGRADDQTTYEGDPAEAAARWRAEGAEFLHVVDLDGAFAGRPAQLDTVRRIVEAFGGAVELGGGLRTDEDLRRALDTGIARAIVGTRACASPADATRLAEAFGARLAVGIDARDGRVQTAGWTETSAVSATELARSMDAAGVRTLIVTDTRRDGMLAGTNVAALGDIAAAVSCGIIASGGVTTPDDIRALRALGRPNVTGAIVGKALYDGVCTFAALRAAAEEVS